MLNYLSLLVSSNYSYCCVPAEITDKEIKNNEDFVWALEVPLTGKFIIDVEFIDLKIGSPNVSIIRCLLSFFLLFTKIVEFGQDL